jgi:DNA (cytosine-5)-methyltransferase 1
MKHGSLFSGIGGFDLAADWMGWENIFHCEIAEFPRKILNHYWPNAECHEDIKKTEFTKYRGTVDIISGGFPCQPYSAAGKRLGKEDDRHLWPEMLRVIREVKPQWVVGENVRGLLNWNGGMVFHEVCADLENIGYEVQAFIIPASGINAPHQRERLWIVAHSSLYANGLSTEGRMDMGGELLEGREREEKTNRFGIISKDATDTQNYGRKTDERINNGTKYKSNDRGTIRNIFNTDGKQRDASDSDKHGRQEQYRNMGEENGKKEEQRNEFIWNAIKSSSKDRIAPDTESQRTREQSSENRGREDGRFNDISEDGNVADTNIKRLKEFNYANKSNGEVGQFDKKVLQIQNWDRFPTQSPVCSGDDGISHGLDNITFSKWRNESIKGYGNAVVPQVVYRIFKTIEYIQNLKE